MYLVRTYGKHVEPYVDFHLSEFRVSFTVSFFQNLRPGYKRPVRASEMFTSVPCPVISTRAPRRCPGDSTELAFKAGAHSVKFLHGRLQGVSCSSYRGTAAERHRTGEDTSKAGMLQALSSQSCNLLYCNTINLQMVTGSFCPCTHHLRPSTPPHFHLPRPEPLCPSVYSSRKDLMVQNRKGGGSSAIQMALS